MHLSVRLDPEFEKKINKAIEKLHITKTELIKRSLEDFLSKILEEEKYFPYKHYQKLQKLVPGSGQGDLSIKHKEKVLKYLKGKHSL